MDFPLERDVLAFVSAAAKSVWTLELLILLRSRSGTALAAKDLVRELRASSKVVQQALADLQNIGLVSARDDQSFVYRPASPQLDELAGAAELLYRTKPVSVINAIALAPNEKLRIFADAFRLKE